MSTALSIIKRAMVYLGALDLRRTPSGVDAETCLPELIALIPSLPGWTGWNEVQINTDYTANDDERIAVIGDVDVTITLPQMVYDDPYVLFSDSGLSIKYGEFFRAPRDGARVLAYAQQGDFTNYFIAYRADIGKWMPVNGYEVGDEVPTNASMDLHLSALLAESIAPLYGLTSSSELQRKITRARIAWQAYYDKRYSPNSPENRSSALGVYM